MAEIKQVLLDQRSDFCACPELLYADDPRYRDTVIDPSDYDRLALFNLVEEGRAIGRVAALLNSRVRYQDLTTGQIGFFECIDDEAAAGTLLDAACRTLGEWGCLWAVGPMNGSTWHGYRFVRPSDAPPIFSEPYHHAYYDRLIRASHFESIATYKTTRVTREHFSFSRLSRFDGYFEARGIRIRSVTPESFSADLRKIYEISRVSFTQNFLYSDIDYDKFYEKYEGMQGLVSKAPVYLAEDREGDPIGFVFCLPNLFARDERSWVIKSLAVVPGRSQQGLGSYLVERVHAQAHAAGIDELFHALMHCDNVSTNIGGTADAYHEYSLYGRAL